MTWKEILESRLLNTENWVLGESITDEQLKQLCVETEFDWPEDFTELYRCHNGIGVLDRAQNQVDWIFIPSLKIASYCTTMRELWFAKTHNSLASNYFPFCNFEYSDAIGYLRVDGEVNSSLYWFHHESYIHRADQNWNEFLTPFKLTLKDWFISSSDLFAEIPPTNPGMMDYKESKIIPALPGHDDIDEIISRLGLKG